MSIKDLMPFGKKSVRIRDEEEHPFNLLRREIDSLFDNFFRSFDILPFESRFSTFSPKVDIVESEKEIKVLAELPGIDEKDIEVTLNKDSLTIKGEKKEEKEEKKEGYYRMERAYGAFSRTIQLPIEIEPDKAEAQLKKGVLTVTLPKSTKTLEETKKINIKAE
ncbi:MAG: Hsp20/alpha crystallin family protein [Thermodesulfovibrionales bacterium]|nr:Hsp20/alpha crystallin family protein [Thermodesulfovibrionales bacterium]